MSFPSNPTNNQFATVNNITYVYNSSKSAWARASSNISVSAITISGNISAGNVIGTHYGLGAGLTGIPNSALNFNSITINGTTVPLGSGITISSVSGSAGNAPAGTLTGGTLASGVTASSLTSVGTLTGLTVSGAIVPSANVTVNLGSPTAWFNTFYGVSTQAKYADLAEIYATDSEYQPGTVMVVGGAAEVTASYMQGLDNVIGAISTNPAYLMNSHYVGQPVALKGRVPVLVIGPVMKGQRLRTSDTLGCAEVNQGHGSYTFAIALFDNSDPGIKLVEAVIL
jgi:hypothetical protein